ncbi:hypothetical protein PRO82_000651 [Candidatus Protochlamydia amoebophila]|nr:hypothetical protein [Candidatus Protochlamydia amoebophila]
MPSDLIPTLIFSLAIGQKFKVLSIVNTQIFLALIKKSN